MLRTLTWILIIFSPLSPSWAKDYSSHELLNSKVYISPLHWHSPAYLESVLPQILSGENEHPLMLGASAIYYLSEAYRKSNSSTSTQELYDFDANSYINKGMSIIERIDNYEYIKATDESILFLYNQKHGKMKAKEWWSGMANSSIALAYLYAFKTTKNEQYKNQAKLAFNGVINEISRGGSAIKINKNSFWYLEYADRNSSLENAHFVLNGFNYSLLVAKIFALEFPEYNAYYQQGINGFKHFSNKFYYPNDKWTYYMINPLDIESPHYAVYDHLLISVLERYDTTNRNFLQSELDRRSKIFKSNYDIARTPDDGLIFSAIGAPHPYWIDLYTTDLILNYKDKTKKTKTIKPASSQKFSIERTFIHVNQNELDDLENIEVVQRYSNRTNTLYKINLTDIPPYTAHLNSQKGIIQSKSLTAWGDIEESDVNSEIHATKSIKPIKNRASKAMFQFNFDKGQNLWKNKYFYIEVESSSKIETIRTILIDDKGNTSNRYYPSLNKGKNIILLSALGYKDQETISENIKKLRFYFYIDLMKTDKNATLKISNVRYMNSSFELYQLLQENSLKLDNAFQFKTKIKTDASKE